MSIKPTPAPTTLEQRIAAQAALVQLFDPIALLPKGVQNTEAFEAIQHIARDSSEVQHGGRVLWRLRPERRQVELRRLVANSLLKEALRAASPLPDDKFARYLKRALANNLPSPDKTPEADRELAATAVAFAQAAFDGLVDDRADQLAKAVAGYRGRITQQAEEQRLRALVPKRLYGRKPELAAIKAFLTSGKPIKDDLVAARPEAPNNRAYLITGTAGAGKSALVWQVVEDWRRAGFKGEPALVLDFDRPGIAHGGELEWTFELTRQLALTEGRLGQALARARADARLHLAENAESATSALSEAFKLRLDTLNLVVNQPTRKERLLIVIDTFEEVIGRSDLRTAASAEASLFGSLLRWTQETAYAAVSAGAFSAVRVLVSGRNTPELPEGTLGDWFAGHREVADLDTESAKAFLKSRDRRQRLSPRRLDLAIDAVGGHPLRLILVERFARNADSKDLDEALADADLADLSGGEAGTAALYSRFLERLHTRRDDPFDAKTLQTLAHPGLVLREVSQTLLREVVAPACGLKLTKSVAAALFERLSQQAWLVETVADRDEATVRHKSDVRRLMLPMMTGSDGPPGAEEPEVRRLARAVHRKAAEYFAAKGDEVEANYHRAFLNDVEAILADPMLAVSVAGAAGEDVAVMPLRARAVLRLRTRGAESLKRAEVAALPAALLAEARLGRVRSGLRQAQTGSADFREDVEAVRHDIPEEMFAGATPPPRRTLREILYSQDLGARVQGAFVNGDFEQAALTAWNAVYQMSAGSELHEPLQESSPLHNWLWQGALAKLATDETLDPELEKLFVEFIERSAGRPFHYRSMGAFFLAAGNLAARGRLTRRLGGKCISIGGEADALAIRRPYELRACYLLRLWPQVYRSRIKLRVGVGLLPLLSRELRPVYEIVGPAGKEVADFLNRLSHEDPIAFSMRDLDTLFARDAEIVVEPRLGFAPLNTALQLNPEIYDFVGTALRKAGLDQGDSLLTQATADPEFERRLWPTGLDPKFHMVLGRSGTSQLIQHADRCGLLSELLRRTLAFRPDAPLSRASKLVDEYEATLARLAPGGASPSAKRRKG